MHHTTASVTRFFSVWGLGFLFKFGFVWWGRLQGQKEIVSFLIKLSWITSLQMTWRLIINYESFALD